MAQTQEHHAFVKLPLQMLLEPILNKVSTKYDANDVQHKQQLHKLFILTRQADDASQYNVEQVVIHDHWNDIGFQVCRYYFIFTMLVGKSSNRLSRHGGAVVAFDDIYGGTLPSKK